MKSLFSLLFIFLLNYSIFSQNRDIDLSKVKLCETKISDFIDTFNLAQVTEHDVCPNGIHL